MQKIFVINWKRKEDATNSSMYSDIFISKASAEHEIVELYLKTSYGDIKKSDNINQIGPFDSKDNKFFGRESMKSAFNKYILNKIYSFADSVIIIFDPRVIEFIPPILMKECRIIFIQAYEHHFSEHPALINRLVKKEFLKDNVDVTVTSCQDDHHLFKSLFDLTTTNMKSNIASKLSVTKRKKSSNRYVMFHGDYKKMNWNKIKLLLASINKKGVVYSHSKSAESDSKKYADDRLLFISSEEEFLKYSKDSVLYNPLETVNIGPSLVQGLSLGIPLILFSKNNYTDQIVGDLERGIYVDLNNPEVGEIKSFINKNNWPSKVENCLELADLKYSLEIFDFSVEKILRRAER